MKAKNSPTRKTAKKAVPAKSPRRKAVVVPVAAAEPSAGEFAILSLSRVNASPHNNRKTFDPDELKRLTDSIKEKGVLEPVIVRPRKDLGIKPGRSGSKAGYFVCVCLPNGVEVEHLDFHVEQADAVATLPRYELVAGERRFRASTLAGKTTIPAIIRDLDDKQAAEIGIIENDQRADVPPMEQAEGYAYLLTLGDDVETIAAKIGRPLKYVAGRLQLTHLADELQEDLRTGKLPFGHAWLLSRLPAGDQVELRKGLYQEWGDEKGKPQPLARLKDTIRRNRLHPLSAAPWKWDDATLVPAAGSCKACPKRSGNNRTLFDELLDKKDKQDKQEFCTDGACYRGKRTAFVELQVLKVAAKNGGEAVRVTERYDSKDPTVLTPGRYEVVTAKEAKAAKPGEVKQAVITDGYESTEVGKVVFIKVKKAGPGATESFDRQQKQTDTARKEKQKAGQAAARAANAMVAEKVAAAADDGTLLTGTSILKQLLLALIGPIGADACRVVANRRDRPKSNDQRGRVEELVGVSESVESLAGILGELVAAHRSFYWGHPHSNGTMSDEDKAFWAEFGVDKGELVKRATADLKAKAAGKGKKGKALVPDDDAGDNPDGEDPDE